MTKRNALTSSCSICFAAVLFIIISLNQTVQGESVVSGADIEKATQNVLSLIEAGDYSKADSEANQLIARFAGNPNVAEAVRQIALKFQYADDYAEHLQKTIKFSRYIVTNCPKSDRAVWAQQAIAMSNMLLGNDANAMAETETLINVYKDDPNLPWALQILGSTYMTSEKFDMGRNTLQEVIQKYPQSKYARKAQLSLKSGEVISLLKKEKYPDAQSALEKILADFKESPDFSGFPNIPEIVISAGEKYYDPPSKGNEVFCKEARGRFEKSVAEIIKQMPYSDFTPEACIRAGDIYHKMGKYEDSIRCFQRVIDRYPDFLFAWHAQFMVGRNYEVMKDSGLISESQAIPKVKAAYEQLISRWPGCKRAEYARIWISQHE